MTDTTAATAATASAAVTPPKPGSPEYNAAMIEKARGSRITENGDQRTVGAEATATTATADATTATAATVATAQSATATAAGAPVAETPAAAAAPAAATPAVKPAGVPDKFWNATTGAVDYTAWNKSTTELEAHFTRSRQAEAAAKKVTDATAAAAAATTPEAKTAAEAALKLAQAEQTVASATPAVTPAAAETTPAVKPVTFEQAQDAASAEFAKDGKLSDASYQTFEKLGIPKVAVDAHIDGLRAKSTAYLGQIYQAGGGKEAYDSMVNWAKVNYSPQEIAAFDSTLRGMDAGQMTMAVNGLKARFVAANGTGGNLLTPNPGGSAPGDGVFSSQAEMTTAMRDPRYSKDAAYRAEVSRKVTNSKRQGINLGFNTLQSGSM